MFLRLRRRGIELEKKNGFEIGVEMAEIFNENRSKGRFPCSVATLFAFSQILMFYNLQRRGIESEEKQYQNRCRNG